MLSEKEKDKLLTDFPSIKLSYENIIHKKVSHFDIVIAIPFGIKCLVWFTEYNDQNVCFIMELNENKKIVSVKPVYVCFKSELSYGTILYGTSFSHLNNSFFTLEDIFYYKGSQVPNNLTNKFSLFYRLMKEDIKQLAYNKHFTIFGLPIFTNNMDDFLKKIICSYKIHTIQFKLFNKSNQFLYMSFDTFIGINNIKTNTNKINIHEFNRPYKDKGQTVFKIKASLQNDIYNLYCLSDDGTKELFYDVAYIPDFDVSVKMNKMFRYIKENDNLDALEESDDEEEFENENIGRFVNLEKSYNMICIFNHKFKKWIPLRIADISSKIITYSSLFTNRV